MLHEEKIMNDHIMSSSKHNSTTSHSHPTMEKDLNPNSNTTTSSTMNRTTTPYSSTTDLTKLANFKTPFGPRGSIGFEPPPLRRRPPSEDDESAFADCKMADWDKLDFPNFYSTLGLSLSLNELRDHESDDLEHDHEHDDRQLMIVQDEALALDDYQRSYQHKDYDEKDQDEKLRHFLPNTSGLPVSSSALTSKLHSQNTASTNNHNNNTPSLSPASQIPTFPQKENGGMISKQMPVLTAPNIDISVSSTSNNFLPNSSHPSVPLPSTTTKSHRRHGSSGSGKVMLKENNNNVNSTNRMPAMSQNNNNSHRLRSLSFDPHHPIPKISLRPRFEATSSYYHDAQAENCSCLDCKMKQSPFTWNSVSRVDGGTTSYHESSDLTTDASLNGPSNIPSKAHRRHRTYDCHTLSTFTNEIVYDASNNNKLDRINSISNFAFSFSDGNEVDPLSTKVQTQVSRPIPRRQKLNDDQDSATNIANVLATDNGSSNIFSNNNTTSKDSTLSKSNESAFDSAISFSSSLSYSNSRRSNRSSASTISSASVATPQDSPNKGNNQGGGNKEEDGLHPLLHPLER